MIWLHGYEFFIWWILLGTWPDMFLDDISVHFINPQYRYLHEGKLVFIYVLHLPPSQNVFGLFAFILKGTVKGKSGNHGKRERATGLGKHLNQAQTQFAWKRNLTICQIHFSNGADFIVIGCYHAPSASYDFVLLGSLNWEWLTKSSKSFKDICDEICRNWLIFQLGWI